MPHLRLVLGSLLLAACGGPVDGGVDATPDGGADSGPPMRCGSDVECGDQSLFCMRWRCMPGEPGTDARGCIDLGPPCDPGQGCDEERDTCGTPAWCTEGRSGCAAPGDCDNDGARAMECGGNDCDDDDNQRSPGRTEVCDAVGLDEDCNGSTVVGPSDGDMDGDMSTSAECCNGSTCGDDCDDGDVNVNPSASEVCDGIDNDCDGGTDVGASLCPGGSCVAGRCDFEAWDRTFGGGGELIDDVGRAVVIDRLGNVYVAGTVGAGSVDFGGGPVTTTGRAVFVAKYRANGAWEWQYLSPAGSLSVADLAISPAQIVSSSWAVARGSTLEAVARRAPFFWRSMQATAHGCSTADLAQSEPGSARSRRTLRAWSQWVGSVNRSTGARGNASRAVAARQSSLASRTMVLPYGTMCTTPPAQAPRAEWTSSPSRFTAPTSSWEAPTAAALRASVPGCLRPAACTRSPRA